MKIWFYSPNRIEPWDWRNVYKIGIGGSETSHVEMAVRLAARGHDVTSFTELPPPGDDFDPEFGGVHWRDLSEADLSADGLWIVYRAPAVGLEIKPGPGRRYWLICQDVWYPTWSPGAVAAFDRIFALCPEHQADMERRDPSIVGRVVMSSNGVNVEDIEAAESGVPPEARNPKRLIWTSSPDRGLKEVLDIFERARETVSDLELAIFYGMDNIERICEGDRTRWPWVQSWVQYDRAHAMPGVTWHGRIGQDALKRELFRAGVWLYPTWFSETSCISCMEAQACGVIPITRPFWAVGHNVRFGGIFVEGEPADPLVKARYVDAVVRVASDPDSQERVRARMMPAARECFDWERWVDQWEVLAMVDMGQHEQAAARLMQAEAVVLA